MQWTAIMQSVVLLLLANGAPVLAKKVLGSRFSMPLDGGLTWFDGRPLFGSSKTIRGALVSILATIPGAALMGMEPMIGALAAMAAMAGDLLSSFVKRRLSMPPSSRALVLDQVPESLFPLLAIRGALLLTVLDIAFAMVIFFVGELVLSKLLYRIRLRDRPY